MRTPAPLPPKTEFKISELRDHPEHYNKILDLYFQPGNRKIDRLTYLPLEARGVGLDGEKQIFRLYRTYGAERLVIESCQRLPVENGKIYDLLHSLGYELDKSRIKQVTRYRCFKFASQIVSL